MLLIVFAATLIRSTLRFGEALVAATLFGIPIGLLLLMHGHSRTIKSLLALIIIGLSAHFLVGSRRAVLKKERVSLLLVCGFAAGVPGGAYGMSRLTLAVYGTMRRWTSQHFRATLQAYFLPASLVGLVSGHAIAQYDCSASGTTSFSLQQLGGGHFSLEGNSKSA